MSNSHFLPELIRFIFDSNVVFSKNGALNWTGKGNSDTKEDKVLKTFGDLFCQILCKLFSSIDYSKLYHVQKKTFTKQAKPNPS